MNIIYVNEAEAVFEPFWDSGESYPNHEKYSTIWEYDISVKNPKTEYVEPMWYGVAAEVDPCEKGEYSVSIRRDCDLDITDFDERRVINAYYKREAYQGKVKLFIDFLRDRYGTL